MNTCYNTNNIDLSIYYNRLEWYDSDRFDEELAELMYDNKIARRLSDEEIKEITKKVLDKELSSEGQNYGGVNIIQNFHIKKAKVKENEQK